MVRSATTKNAILDAIFNATAYSVATPYISLHTADPGATGASEVAEFVREMKVTHRLVGTLITEIKPE